MKLVCKLMLVIYSISLFLFSDRLVTKEHDQKTEFLYELDWLQEETEEETEEAGQEAIWKIQGENAPQIGLLESFWMEEDGTFYLLDCYEQKVLKIVGTDITEIPLTQAWLPGDMVCFKDEIYIYDELKGEFQIYNKDGCCFQHKIELEEDYVKGLEIKSGKVVAVTYGGFEISIQNRETGTLQIQKMPLKYAEYNDEYEFSEMIGNDRWGNTYFLNTNLVQDCSVISGEVVISAVSLQGEILGEYVLPVEECSYLPQRYVQVMNDGRIYLLLARNGEYELWQIALSKEKSASFDQQEAAAKMLEMQYTGATESRRKRKSESCFVEIMLTREEAAERVENIVNHVWYLTASALTTSRPEQITFPRYISKMTEGYSLEEDWKIEMTGIPYCWGGTYSTYTGWGNTTFDRALYELNYLAGNINTTGNYKGYTAGLDCSGMICTVYGIIPRLSTRKLIDVGSSVKSMDELQPLDMLVSPEDHVVLFHAWLDAGTMLVSEVSVKDGKAVTHPRSVNEFLVKGTYQMRSPWE